MSERIPINKGNYSMDTPAREALFEQYRSEGWECEYNEYRRNWSEYPEKKYVAEYPLLVDLEISSVCNLRCPMCYTITEEYKQKVNTKLIDSDLFYKIIDEIADKVPSLRLSLRGEPLLHKDVIPFMRYAKKRGMREISFLTNLSRVDNTMFLELLESGADWITVSIDGLNETYEGIRKPLKFEDTFRKIRDIHEIKKRLQKHKPVIKIQSVWPAIKNDPEKYYNTFVPYVDLIAFNPLIDYLGNDSEIVYMDDFSCPQHYQRLVVGADGFVMMCSNDEENSIVVGDAWNQSIYDIWHGEDLNSIRELHKKTRGFLEIPVCRKCYLPRATEDSERATVNNREFIVLNYVNRQQMIGK